MKTGFRSNLAWFLALLMIVPPFSAAWAVCDKGTAVPPFLSSGDIPPSLMVIIDNSASMYDLAYIDTTTVNCFDDSYDPTEVYAGYFEADTVYVYDLNSASTTYHQFQAIGVAGDPAVSDAWSAATYSGTDAAITISIVGVDAYGNDIQRVDAFAARGNLLNWAAASKFDIEKQILTGGKYDADEQALVMESRGCLNHRYAKQYPLESGGTTYYLTMGVRPPIPNLYKAWENNKSYSVGNIVYNPFTPEKRQYICTVSGTSNGSDVTDDTGVTWALYTAEQRYQNTHYNLGATVTDPAENNTVNEGRMYICIQAGTTPNASGNTVYTDNDPSCAGCPKWEPYNLTHIDLFPVTDTGFDITDCALAVAEMQKESPNQGQLKQYIDDCMNYKTGQDNTNRGAQRASFNHAIHNCWYYAKHGDWQPGNGSVNAMQSSCENVYNYSNPWDLTPWDPGYACYGIYSEYGTPTQYFQTGYVGRCFKYKGDVDMCKEASLNTTYSGAGGRACECTPTRDNQPTGFYSNCCSDKNANDWEPIQPCPTVGPSSSATCKTASLAAGFTGDACECTYARNGNASDSNYNCCSSSDAAHWDDPGIACVTLNNSSTCKDASLLAGYTGEACECTFAQHTATPCCASNDPADWDIAGVPCPPPTPCYQTVCTCLSNFYQKTCASRTDCTTLTNVAGGTCPNCCLPKKAGDAIWGDCVQVEVPCPPGGGGGGEFTAVPIEPASEGFDPAGGGGQGSGGGPASSPAWGEWVKGSYTDIAECIEIALQDYCGIVSLPPVIDYSDEIQYDVDGGSVDTWNLPAVLIDSGIAAQLDSEPILAMKGLVAWDKTDPATGAVMPPSGLIQEFALQIRMGITAFNYDGSLTECGSGSPNELFDCDNPSIRDGAKIMQYIGRDDPAAAPALLWPANPNSHTAGLVNAINDIKGTTWTPMGEAFYNTVGYFTQNTSLRIDSRDWKTPSEAAVVGELGPADPILEWCQGNHVLLISDGSSTTDLYDAMMTLVPDATDCPPLFGSTALAELTEYAMGVFGDAESDPDASQNRNIRTHIVIAGSLRDTGGADLCNPALLMEQAAENGGTELKVGSTPAELAEALRSVFSNLRTGTASGSAASVISASRGGEGAIYQAIFWPDERDGEGETANRVTWFGEVHALLIDAQGLMYEDTDGDRSFSGADRRVTIYFDELAKEARACYGDLDENGACLGDIGDIHDVNYLWSASDWLSQITNADIVTHRASFVSNEKKRHIFTWNDLNADGVVSNNEVMPFTAATGMAGRAVSGGRAPVAYDFGVYDADPAVAAAEVNKIVNWLRGLDQTGLRNRGLDYDGDGTLTYYRLGDVIHSTPMAVTRPSEAYHLMYRDQSYAKFAAQHKNRRHVIYFGGNDGMVHAVNGGFYNATLKKFCLTPNCDGEDAAPELGAELWAYVPYNLAPHLACLTNPNYGDGTTGHKYYVDQQPRVFDAQIFTPNPGTGHVDGWGTVLVMGMRLGGYPVEMGTRFAGDSRVLASSYMIFDITNPEMPPKLLGEMTYTGGGVDAAGNREMKFNSTSGAVLGYTSVDPGVAPLKQGTITTWNLLLGSGPTFISNGANVGSDLLPRLGVVDLERIRQGASFRIPVAPPDAATESGSFIIGTSPGYLGDIITVDFDLHADYMADAVYFGTVTGSSGAWGGKMYRLVTRKPADQSAPQELSRPHEWSGLLADTTLNQQVNPSVVIDVGEPITAPPTMGTDLRNYWLNFGTGKFMDAFDKVDHAGRGFYAIKEPQEFTPGYVCKGQFTWETVAFPSSPDSAPVPTSLSTAAPGQRGLLRVDTVRVLPATTAKEAALTCSSGGVGCLPAEIQGEADRTFDKLTDVIAGPRSSCAGVADNYAGYGLDGWWRRFDLDLERNLGKAALLGGLLTFTTYRPFDDVCLPEGLAYLYGVYYKTGTAWHEPIFSGGTLLDASGTVEEKISLGRGLALTPNVHKGEQEGKTDFVQTSTGAIVEIPEVNLPVKTLRSGRQMWKEIDNQTEIVCP